MKRYRSYVLPSAILLGLLLHKWCAILDFTVPYLIFTILLLNFAATDLKKLKVEKLDWFIMSFQLVVSLGGYFVIKALVNNDILAQGFLCGVICPVAASVAVVSCMLGANRERVITYSIIGNLFVAIATPIIFSFIGTNCDMPFFQSFLQILGKIGPTIALPFVIVLFFHFTAPRINQALTKIKDISFYLWALVLLLTLGKTIDFVFLHGEGNRANIIWLGVLSLLMCIVQFAVGKKAGARYGDKMAGGQLLGQKNAAVGIWMANTYLLPLTSVFLAFYSIWQNLFNSWQLWKLGQNGHQ